jgi:hypothetical protein
MAERGFEVFMYDHTIEALPAQHPNFHFFPVGICGDNGGDRLRRLRALIEANGHASQGDMVLKMDVEGAEWDVFADMEIATLESFAQIVVELHWLDEVDRDDLYSKMKTSLSKLVASFAPVHVHGNNCSDLAIVGGIAVPQVLEVTFVRRADFSTVRSSKLFPTTLDVPNRLGYPDLHLGSFRFSE